MLRETKQTKIYVCGYCDEIISEKIITKHLKNIHNATEPEVVGIVTKVIML